ncbi:uncharacterized protein [Eurosta solidaginis]|uniref:uncharacterized protein n=1 Tax=Eurosta solidaginis TaxID=178769 RepID=UPI003530F248
MKPHLLLGFYVLFVLSIVALVMAKPQSPQKQCEEACPTTGDKVCGYDSVCYTVFDNKCKYDYLKCKTKHNLETVDMSLCDLADRRTHPHYSLC